ncbi:general stress protein [Kribbella sp. NPDC004536]|uniref:general stress protein n=1 Tax=Kribbella sp. NPDC004536 TaxID=3364106 RepID=UPI0036782829
MTTTEQTTALIRGRTVASFTSYAEAQRAVDYLSDNGFPVENITIVGSDLKQVERVLGRMTKWKAALAGAGTGAWFGVLIGLLLSLFADSGTAVVVILLWGLLYGAIFGAIFGFIAHLLTFGERDFSASGMTVATRYEVYCTSEHAARAAEMLARMPTRGATTA